QEIVWEFGTNEVSQMKKYDLNAIIPDSRFEYEVPDSAYVWYQDGSGRKQREPLVELPPLEKPK
ncbi:MAG: hypothetical protein KDA65_09695, partial [Planctomycetaceae bacterium]|nr:hypothetical protein [Planctomycetaceae bacterium]